MAQSGGIVETASPTLLQSRGTSDIIIPSCSVLLVSHAEARLLHRLRGLSKPSLVHLAVGGDGQPKEIISIQEAQREVLAK